MPGHAVVATAGNLNNELGVPLTVLRADAGTTHLVVEMGARGVGHIAYLCEIAPPRVAAVLNVGTAHLSEFGSREAIAAAKGEIVEALPASGVAVLNADDDLTAAMAPRTPARCVTVGEQRRGHLARARGRRPRPALVRARPIAGEWHPVRLLQSGPPPGGQRRGRRRDGPRGRPRPGRRRGRARHGALRLAWRMEVHERDDGLLLVNDAYNANPASMVAALGTVGGIGARRGRRTVAVLGEMKELGTDHDAGHREVGRAAAAAGIDVVVVVGEAAAGIAEGAPVGRRLVR